MQGLLSIFDSQQFMPHGMCFLWRPELLILHAVSDSLTALAYYSIPAALVYFTLKRIDLEFRWMFVAFGVFILACGTTHVFAIWTLWNPDYGVAGLVKAATAVASLITAALLWRIMPQALAIPSKRQLEVANCALEREIGERHKAETAVRELNAQLERRIRDRTADLERTNVRLQHEIVERQRHEKEIAAKSHLLETILESMDQGILVVGADGHIVTFNRRFVELNDLPPDRFHPGDSFEDFVRFNVVRGDHGPGDPEAIFALRLEAIRAAPNHPYERRVPNGTILEIRGAPMPGGGFVRTFTNVTAARQAEEQLRQSQKMKAIGQLTGGVAHDFNNLLTVILGNAEVLAEALGQDTRLTRLVQAIDRAAQRCAELTQRLLAFARRQALAPTAINLSALVTDMDAMLHRSLGEDIDIERKLAGDLWNAMADPGQVENALLNLALNARDAMPDGGRLTIETANVRLDDHYAAKNPGVVPGAYVMLAVSDTGIGMTPDVLKRAFEPFFTTKETGKGTGLGLSMVYGFAKQSGGHVNIYSEPGQGTTVRLYLPRTEERPKVATTAAAITALDRGSGETVLVVEDDPVVRAFVVSQLKTNGYHVTAAHDGASALAMLEAHGPVDLLFTDVVMPGGMNGRQLAEEAKRRQPGLKVLFTSGYAESVIVHQGKLDPGVSLLTKPYRIEDLLKKIRATLIG
jgi:signal transduction histidine kinase